MNVYSQNFKCVYSDLPGETLRVPAGPIPHVAPIIEEPQREGGVVIVPVTATGRGRARGRGDGGRVTKRATRAGRGNKGGATRGVVARVVRGAVGRGGRGRAVPYVNEK